MSARIRKLIGLIRSHPLRATSLLVVLAALLGVGGCYLWNEHNFRAAVRDLEEQRFADAIKHLGRVWPKGVETHFLLARTARRCSAFDDARHELEICEQLGASGEGFSLEAVLLGVQQGNLAGAETMLRERADRGTPDAPYILEALAQAYLRTYHFDRALECIDRLLKRQPDHVLALQWHGQMMEHINRRDEALEDYRRVLEVNPDEKWARLSLADVLLKLKHFGESLEHFQRLAQRWPNDPAVRLGIARCARGLGRNDQAKQLLDVLLAEYPDEAGVLFERGKIALDDGEFERAESLLRRAQAHNPFDEEMMYVLFQYLSGHRQDDEAKRLRARLDQITADRQRLVELTKTVVEHRRAPAERAEAGSLCLRLGMTDHALSLLETALQEDPNNLRAAEGLVEYYQRIREPARADVYRRRVGEIKERIAAQPKK